METKALHTVTVFLSKIITKEQESLGAYRPQESVTGDTNNISLIT